jgi:ubiquinone/menaquinone biosynthesis C-methylase UbiE
MTQLAFDEATARRMEVLYRTGDVRRRRRLVLDALAPAAGERILDVGCGPGFYLADVLERVGPSGFLTGVDSSPPMLAIAAERCAEHANIELREGDATALPVADAAFDGALCVQVLEYVRDATGALAELRRALRPGGRAVVWDVDWTTVSWHADDPGRMARALGAWDEHLTHPALPRTLTARMAEAGFRDVRCEGHVFATTELSPDAYVTAALPLVEDYVGQDGRLGAAEARAWAGEQRRLSEEGRFFFACIQFCFSGTR